MPCTCIRSHRLGVQHVGLRFRQHLRVHSHGPAAWKSDARPLSLAFSLAGSANGMVALGLSTQRNTAQTPQHNHINLSAERCKALHWSCATPAGVGRASCVQVCLGPSKANPSTSRQPLQYCPGLPVTTPPDMAILMTLVSPYSSGQDSKATCSACAELPEQSTLPSAQAWQTLVCKSHAAADRHLILVVD